MFGPRIRARAINLLEARAGEQHTHLAKTAIELGIPLHSPAYKLAQAAFYAVPTIAYGPEYCQGDALEASGILRDGWEPGRTLRLLPRRGVKR